jgi:hypothetical protein
MKHHWHRYIELPANWKVAQEAFFEGYHVPQTHSQLMRRQIRPRAGLDTDRLNAIRRGASKVTLTEQGHGIWGSVDGKRGLGRLPPEWVEGMSVDEQVDLLIEFHEEFMKELECMTLEDDVLVAKSMRERAIPDGSSVDEEFQRALREYYAAHGRAIGPSEAISKAGIIHIFPNYTFLPMYGNVVIYRSRPSKDNNPDRCIFEVWSCRTYAEGEAPPPKTQVVTDPMDPAQMCLFLRQDFSNIPRQQIGMHSGGLQSTLLHGVQEQMIRSMHSALDRLLEA